MTTFLILVAAGLAGALLRAVTSTTQRTCSREGLTDTAVGGLVSPVIFLMLGSVPYVGPAMAKLDEPIEQSVFVFFVGYAASHVAVSLIRKRLGGWIAKAVDARTAPKKDDFS